MGTWDFGLRLMLIVLRLKTWSELACTYTQAREPLLWCCRTQEITASADNTVAIPLTNMPMAASPELQCGPAAGGIPGA